MFRYMFCRRLVRIPLFDKLFCVYESCILVVNRIVSRECLWSDESNAMCRFCRMSSVFLGWIGSVCVRAYVCLFQSLLQWDTYFLLIFASLKLDFTAIAHSFVLSTIAFTNTIAFPNKYKHQLPKWDKRKMLSDSRHIFDDSFDSFQSANWANYSWIPRSHSRCTMHI